MVTLEMVERLREKAGVSFELAKEALENSGGDLLDAMIYLERMGHIPPPAAGGFCSGADDAQEETPKESAPPRYNGRTVRETLGHIGRACLRLLQIGNTNSIEVMRGGQYILSCPITLFVVLLLVGFWVIVPLMVLGLFFGFRYRIIGKELGSEAVNKVMDEAAETAEEIKSSITSKPEKTEE
jgi:hypothetical protein